MVNALQYVPLFDTDGPSYKQVNSIRAPFEYHFSIPPVSDSDFAQDVTHLRRFCVKTGTRVLVQPMSIDIKLGYDFLLNLSLHLTGF